MKRCFINRIREFQGKLVYEILGKNKESKGDFFVVYREWVDGHATCRNLAYSRYSGYFTLPGKETMDKCILDHTPNIGSLLDYLVTEKDKELLIKHYPNFKYILAKRKVTRVSEVLPLLRKWLKNPQMELLLNYGFERLASDENFFKLKKEKQKAAINYWLKWERKACLDDLTDQHHRRFVSLGTLLGAMKRKISPWEYLEYKDKTTGKMRKLINYPTFLKINAAGIWPSEYYHYMQQLNEYFPQRTKDEYWTKFTSSFDFHATEKKVADEIENIKKVKKEESARRLAEQYAKAISRKKKWTGIFNGMEVYIPTTIPDIELQAEKLNQCLIYCDYVEKVAKKQCVLVFIRKNGIPIATAELTSNCTKLSQFYGNELDPDNCDPPENAKIALTEWAKKFPKIAC